jgi:ssDNA-specific exonuclease RecJ
MKYIKAVFTCEIPKDKLNEEEMRDWPISFEELKKEISETSPEGVICTLTVEEIERQ